MIIPKAGKRKPSRRGGKAEKVELPHRTGGGAALRVLIYRLGINRTQLWVSGPLRMNELSNSKGVDMF